MAWFGWLFKKKEPEDYETVLSTISLSIQSKEQRLSELRLRERRASLVVTIYAFGFWVVYLAIWWTFLDRVRIFDRDGGTRRRKDKETIDKIVKGIPAVIGPIVILFVRRIVQLWYASKGDAEEKHLKSLRTQHRTKIEEIKKKTNFYSTKSLLDRYDEGSARKPTGPNTPQNLRQRRANATPGGPGPSQGTLTPQSAIRGSGPAGAGVGPVPAPTRGRELEKPSQLQARFPGVSLQQQPMTPPRKQWYDKLADALLGDDEATTGSSSRTRFALICENCFAHNGLVREDDFDDMRYVCPKCGHFNRSRRDGSRSTMTSRAPSLAPTMATSINGGRRNRSSSPPLPSPTPTSPTFPRYRGRQSAPSAMSSVFPPEVEEDEEEERERGGESHEEKSEGKSEGKSEEEKSVSSEKMDVDKDE